jgi:hypothetical protein
MTTSCKPEVSSKLKLLRNEVSGNLSPDGLKSCPFCGVIPSLHDFAILVECKNKVCPILNRSMTIEKWNRRAA